MSSLQEILNRKLARKGPDGLIVKQLRNQIMSKKRNKSTQQIHSGGMTANHSPKTDARLICRGD